MTQEFDEALPTPQLQQIAERLQDGGPPVNHALIAQLVADALEPDVEETVRELTRMYRPWFREYWSFYSDTLPVSDKNDVSTVVEPVADVQSQKTAVHNRIAKYFAMADNERLACFGEIGTRGDGTPLNPYLIDLAELIRDEWDWEDRREQPEYQSQEAQAEALFEFLAQQDLDLPFPLDLVAVELVDMGLDELGGIED